ncbi:MAG: hypothetical protein A2W93_06895 [Bacteroidetes bacterium GWF2_43_63]|nr:MAG: hypothetical protein A2W94_07640 [Bacteroidetes bacterium GWE2_42_42]OFY53346.1 MAG: hypothetical protein A2W93_06895 [Bacteroidetes bacterium GWF2_43_63]HBG71658.1 hypothetical protein [Bacteroidales bacterium]HCB61677.1 hypothetical protein [Bacteroidales bacterium]HCY22889.1 hypothetical protein [Bacteroidales bacterium]
MNQKDNTQDAFIDSLRAVIPSGHSLVNELADQLELSIDSAYRRLRGETEFSLSEIVKLCNHFHISFDSFCSAQGESVHFHYNLPGDEAMGFQQFVEHIRDGLQKLKSAKDSEIIYVADDIPFFLLFAFPQLAWFKCYYWMRSVMNVLEYQHGFFEDEIAPDVLMTAGQEILEAYRMAPSTEIWSEHTLNSILKQIDFYSESGFFKDSETSQKLYADLLLLVSEIRTMTESGTKRKDHAGDNNFTFYLCDIEIGNNCIYTSIGKNKKVFLRHSTFNTLETADEVFCSATRDWLNGLIRKSTQLSGMAEKQRNKYFQFLLGAVKSKMNN